MTRRVMRVYRMLLTLAAAAICIAFSNISACAEPLTFTTVGTFNCDGCKGSGTNSVTFGGGGDNSLTLSFAGEAATLSDLSLGYVFASFGKFQVSAAGSGGMIPPGTTFTLTITQTAP